MKKIKFSAILMAMILTFSAFSVNVFASEPTYTFTARGQEMTLPLSHFATRVISFQPGSPWTTNTLAQNTNNALGFPVAGSNNVLNLGTRGSIVLAFDSYIIDGPGIDLVVFEEVNPPSLTHVIEPMRVELSNDLENWIYVGTANAWIDGIDISGHVPEGARFRYVRLTCIGAFHTGAYPGAELFGVAIVHREAETTPSALRILLEVSEVVQLSVTFNLNDNRDLTWTSADSSVASVDADGRVTGVSEGETEIFAVSPDGDFSESVLVIVFNEGEAEELRLVLHLVVNETRRLFLNFNFENITWRSMDSSVVTVDSNGRVTGVSRGFAIITAEYEGEMYVMYIRVEGPQTA